jgi:hypothetical protein
MFPFVLDCFACNINKYGNALSLNIYLQVFVNRYVLCSPGRFLQTGTFYYTLNNKRGCEAIWKILVPLHMAGPTKEMLLSASNEFYQRWNFPNCIGSIDGKHIRLKCPPNSGSMYYNYKQYYSIVLQALAGARYRFIAIDVGAYGKQSDGGIFRRSSLYQLLNGNNFNIPDDKELPLTDVKLPFVILGDEAYPLLSYLMRPFPRRQLTESKRVLITVYSGADE